MLLSFFGVTVVVIDAFFVAVIVAFPPPHPLANNRKTIKMQPARTQNNQKTIKKQSKSTQNNQKAIKNNNPRGANVVVFGCFLLCWVDFDCFLIVC